MLVSLEAGKILQEGEGEVQEMIDICDFATGLSRQLHGLVIASERPGHRMLEQWHPLGVVGIISAFNFPVAVWAWNSALAAVCGDATVWKPSEKVPLTAIACIKIAEKVCRECDVDPAVFSLAIGPGSVIGELMANDSQIPLVSATGSSRMGKRLGAVVAQRFGRTILELGGNNAIVVTPSADFNLARRAIVFGAVGTAGQRCTTTRRLFVQKGIAPLLISRLTKAYQSIRIGDPLEDGTLMGPLIDANAVAAYERAVAAARASSDAMAELTAALAGMGECQVERGEAASAAAALEPRVAWLGQVEAEPGGAARARLALARALVAAGDRERARALALAARDGFATLGAAGAARAAEVARWLARPR